MPATKPDAVVELVLARDREDLPDGTPNGVLGWFQPRPSTVGPWWERLVIPGNQLHLGHRDAPLELRRLLEELRPGECRFLSAALSLQVAVPDPGTDSHQANTCREPRPGSVSDAYPAGSVLGEEPGGDSG